MSTAEAKTSDGAKQWLALPGKGTGWVRPEWQDAFAGAGFRSFEDFISDAGVALHKEGLGHRYRACLELKHEGRTDRAFLKRYRDEPFGSRFRRLVEDGAWTTPAHRDVHVAETLFGLGISVPKTLAWGYDQKHSFIVSAAVPGEALSRLLQDGQVAALAFAQRADLSIRVGRLAGAFHESGYCHRDFYLCHIFALLDDNPAQLSIIDLQRVFRPRWRRTRWVVKDLAQLNFSAMSKCVSRTMKLRFVKAYFGYATLNAAHRALLRRVESKTRRIAQREMRRKV